MLRNNRIRKGMTLDLSRSARSTNQSCSGSWIQTLFQQPASGRRVRVCGMRKDTIVDVSTADRSPGSDRRGSQQLDSTHWVGADPSSIGHNADSLDAA